MPKRPAQHVTRSESTRAFISAVPAAWVCHERTEDYGIDVDVEIFDGEATGLNFATQVKGEASLRGKPKVRVKRSTWNYWRSQAVPVLVVLWDRRSGDMYWEWSYRFDPEDAHSDTRKLTLHFPSSQKWDSATPAALTSAVEAYRAWSSPLAHLPLSVVTRGSHGVGGVKAGSLLAALRRRLNGFGNVVEVRSEPRGPLYFEVDLRSDDTVVTIAGGGRLHLHHDQIQDADLDLIELERFTDQVAADLVLGLSYHLANVGLTAESAELAASATSDATIVLHPTSGASLIALLGSGGRVADALDLLQRIVIEGRPEGVWFAFEALQDVGHTSPEVRDAVVHRLIDWAYMHIAAGDPRHQAAQYVYNASTFLRQADPQRASELLLQAASLDESYRERSYWWRELGGTRFLEGMFEEAVKCYETALEMGDALAGPTLADALMRSGQYRQALTRWTESGTSTHPEWRLSHRALRYLVQRTGIEVQARDSDAAQALVNNGQFEEALRADLLHGEALYRLARETLRQPEDAPGVDLAIATAALEPRAAIAWVLAMGVTAVHDPDLYTDVAHEARRYCGDEIVAMLLESVPDDAETSEEHLELASRIFDEVPQEEWMLPVVRLTSAGSPDYLIADRNTGEILDRTGQPVRFGGDVVPENETDHDW
jgi:tetratricopeptide (TPR) repeat protein